MIFSLFGRKESKTAARRRAELGDPERARLAENSAPLGERTRPGESAARVPSAREIARMTAAKIDEIEQQMISVTPSHGIYGPAANTLTGAAAGPLTAASPAGTVFLPSRSAANESAAPPDSIPALSPESAPNTSTILGHARGAMAVEIGASELPPAFEEAAVLYSNGQAGAATTVLWQAIRENRAGKHVTDAWLMLFDLYQASGRKADFESLAVDFTSRFERSPPGWDEADAPGTVLPRPAAAAPTVEFPPALDADARSRFEQAQRAAARGRAVVLDFGAIRSVDAVGADLLLRTLRGFARSEHTLLLARIEPLVAALQAAIAPGRRDASDACWMLLLEMLRLQGLKQQFEDLGIDYCVTFEVSPPSWEPMPPNLRLHAAQVATLPAVAPGFAVGPEAFVLRGEIEGRMLEALAALREYALDRAEIVVDCRRLRRLDFVAAGELLNEVVALRSGGKYLVFRDTNRPCAALLAVMGITDLAEVRVRRG